MELKSESEDLWLVRHTNSTRYSCWIGLPLITISSLYVITIPLFQSSYELIAIALCLFLGGPCIYLCYPGFKVFPYLRADIEANNEGFSIYYPNGKSNKYIWSQVGKLNHYPAIQVLEFISTEGNQILAVYESATSYNALVQLAVKYSGCTYK